MKEWLVLFTKPRAERRIANYLSAQGIETFNPEIRYSRGPNQVSFKPLFPNYIFAEIDLATDALSKLNWTPGLRHIVSFNGVPSSIPGRIVDELRSRAAHLSSGHANGARFQKGDRVVIKTGPFRNLLGIFERQTSSAERVQILMDVLGARNRVLIDANALEVAEPATPEIKGHRARRTRGRGRRIKA